MALRDARSVSTNPLPATAKGPFATAELELHDHGLAPIPLGGDPKIDDDAQRKRRKPLVRSKGLKHRHRRETISKWIDRFPAANVGILPGLSGITVVDIDDTRLIASMILRFGDTPLKTETPSGGVHLWYQSNGEPLSSLGGDRHRPALACVFEAIA